MLRRPWTVQSSYLSVYAHLGYRRVYFCSWSYFFIRDYNPEHNEDLKILGKVKLPNKLLAISVMRTCLYLMGYYSRH
jgi:hypothetical protein